MAIKRTNEITDSIKKIPKNNVVGIQRTREIKEKLKKISDITNNTTDNKLKTGAITFLDILGWKGIWSRDSDAIQKLERLTESLEEYAIENSSGKTYGKSGAFTLKTEIKIISDTVVIITIADKSISSDAIDMHGELSKLAIIKSITDGIPFRGATSFGEFQISDSNNILVGKAVDEAASWHEKANWIGVFMTPTANYLYNHNKSNIWVKNKPPLKERLEFDTFSVSWLNNDTQIEKYKTDFALMSPILPEFFDKFQNTIKFLENIQKNKTLRKRAGKKERVKR